MRVRIAESTLVHDLLDFLRRCGCEVEQSSADVLEVQLHPEVSEPALTTWWARMEVDEFLRVWSARHSDADVVVLG